MRARAICAVGIVIALALVLLPAHRAAADGVVTGRTEWVSGNTLIFKNIRREDSSIEVDPAAQIIHNGQRIPLGQLRWGSALTISYVDGPYGPIAIRVVSTGHS